MAFTHKQTDCDQSISATTCGCRLRLPVSICRRCVYTGWAKKK